MNQCFRCVHWNGDKELAEEMLKDNPLSLDLWAGWPSNGRCDQFCQWGNLDVYGDASVILTVDANFGCVYFETEEGKE
jgi:hypothetical protein